MICDLKDLDPVACDAALRIMLRLSLMMATDGQISDYLLAEYEHVGGRGSEVLADMAWAERRRRDRMLADDTRAKAAAK